MSNANEIEREVARHKDGKFGHGMDRLCVCGHTRGHHLDGGAGKECIAHEMTEGAPVCPCEAFKAARKR